VSTAIPVGEFNISYTAKLVLADGTEGYLNADMIKTQRGCVQTQASSWFMTMYPTLELVLWMASLPFTWVGFAFSPISIYRIVTGDSASSAGKGFAVLHWFPFLFFIPVLLIGIAAVVVKDPFEMDGQRVFMGMCLHIAKLNVAGAGLVLICLVSGLASFMSTADSIAIAASSVLTMDVWKKVLRPNASMRELSIVSKSTSGGVLCVGILFGCYSKLDVLSLLNMGNGCLIAMLWVYLGIFFWKLKALPVIVGQIVTIIVSFVLEGIRYAESLPQTLTVGSPPLPMPLGMFDFRGPGTPDHWFLWIQSPLFGVIGGGIVTGLLQAVLPESAHEKFHQIQGFSDEVLTKTYGDALLHKGEEGAAYAKRIFSTIVEPVGSWKGRIAGFGPLILMFLVCPWPYIYGRPGSHAAVVGGIPYWTLIFIFGNFFGTSGLCFNSWIWDDPEDTPEINAAYNAAKLAGEKPPEGMERQFTPENNLVKVVP